MVAARPEDSSLETKPMPISSQATSSPATSSRSGLASSTTRMAASGAVAWSETRQRSRASASAAEFTSTGTTQSVGRMVTPPYSAAVREGFNDDGRP